MGITGDSQAPLPMSALDSSRELSMSPPLVPETCTSPQPIAQDPGSGADPVEFHGRIPNGFDPLVFVVSRWCNGIQKEPLTVPNLAGELPCSEYGQVHKIHDKLSSSGIRAVYLHYHLRYPSCEGLSESDARRFRLSELEAYHGIRESDRQALFDIFDFRVRNIHQTENNFHHSNREEAIEVVIPLHPVGFDIPNTVPGLEQLSVAQKRELLTACYGQRNEDDLDLSLMASILIAFRLSKHLLTWDDIIESRM